MKATDLQSRLVHLAPGETLLLLMAEIDRAFPFCPSPEARRNAVVDLAWFYRCDVTFCGPSGDQALFIPHGNAWPTNFDETAWAG